MVQNDEIVIVDEHTAEQCPADAGRRIASGDRSQGERVDSERDVTLASTTFQNHFR
jgi:preprotein translocase subunit SecA